MPSEIHRRVSEARRGEHPALVARMRSGWLVMGDRQILPGYCLLLPDPVVGHLNELKGEARADFLADMALAGDALIRVTGAVRINYEMLGNLEPALHAHLIPRYAGEPSATRTKPVWLMDWEAAPYYDETSHGNLRKRLRRQLEADGLVLPQ
ncbi:MAG: hypothetical protein KIS66_08000 [Fimbriimonadaceae bacterium]|nr:hypothetical protein [Fimbriimonadaceae bacterium]